MQMDGWEEDNGDVIKTQRSGGEEKGEDDVPGTILTAGR